MPPTAKDLLFEVTRQMQILDDLVINIANCDDNAILDNPAKVAFNMRAMSSETSLCLLKMRTEFCTKHNIIVDSHPVLEKLWKAQCQSYKDKFKDD